MSSEQQIEIYRQHRTAQDKYVYFLLASAGRLTRTLGVMMKMHWHNERYCYTKMSSLRHTLILSSFLCLTAVANAKPDNFEWLPQFVKQMESVTFIRKDAEATLKPHSELFEILSFNDEHPGYSDCDEHSLRIEMNLVSSMRPSLTAIEKLFGHAKKLPTFPDDFSGREIYSFYLPETNDEVSVRVFAEISDGSQRITKFSIDREKGCPVVPNKSVKPTAGKFVEFSATASAAYF